MPQTLNDLMEFDHVIEVHEDGTISEPQGIYAPEMLDDELDRQGWTLLTGWTGQYGYAGPTMHASEYIGGALERHIRETPGVYVAIVAYASADESIEESDGNPVDAGWAIARQV